MGYRFVQRQRVRQISDGKSLGRKGGGMNAIITVQRNMLDRYYNKVITKTKLGGNAPK